MFRHLPLIFFMTAAFAAEAVAEESPSATVTLADLSHLMGFHVWKFPAKAEVLAGRAGDDIVLVTKAREKGNDTGTNGTYNADSPLVVVVQNAE